MGEYLTARSGRWHDPTTWSPQGVPGLGDRVYIQHLVYTEQTVVVGTGEVDAVQLSLPLVCFSNLFVLGGLRGIENGGLFFLSEELDWVFFASEGFELPPVSQDTLNSLWQGAFGGGLPEGYIIPIAGRIPADAYFAPHRHELLTPLLQMLRQRPEVFAAHYDVQDPRSAGKVYLSLFDTDGSLFSPASLASFVQNLKAQAATAESFNTTLQWSVDLSVDPPLALYLWLKERLRDSILGVVETATAYKVLLRRHVTLQDAVRSYAQASGTIAEATLLFSLIGITKPIIGEVV